jgi:hypothetical protein
MWDLEGKTATFYLDCCPNAVKITDLIRGLDKLSANDYYNNHGGDALLLKEGEAPYSVNILGYCSMIENNDAAVLIEDQGIYSPNSNSGHDYIMGTDTSIGDMSGDIGETHIKCECNAFVLARVERLPAGTTIASAKMKFRTTNYVKAKRLITATHDESGVHYTDHGWTYNAINGEISFLLIAEDTDGEIYLISMCANTAITNNTGEWVEIDITDLIQNYLTLIQGSIYTKVAIMATPSAYTIEAMQTSEKLLLIDAMKATWLIEAANYADECNIGCFASSNYCTYSYLNNIEIGEVEVTFDLPDMSQFEVPYRNLPGFGS